MRVNGSGQSHDAVPLYWRGKLIPWPIEGLLYVAVFGAVCGALIGMLSLIIQAAKHWPMITMSTLVVGYLCIALWARWRAT